MQHKLQLRYSNSKTAIVGSMSGINTQLAVTIAPDLQAEKGMSLTSRNSGGDEWMDYPPSVPERSQLTVVHLINREDKLVKIKILNV